MKRILAALLLCIVLLPVSTIALAPPQIAHSKRAVSSYQGNPDVRVWVNTASGVYHCPGTRWYGNTKRGEYMTQKQAREKGNRPAYGKVCR